MGILYVDTGGSALNSGSSDSNTADLSGALAVQASTVVTLDGSPDLSGVVTSGAAQSSINLQGASNANRTVFWITAVANSGSPTASVTVDVAPTGTLAGWKIGGRYLWPSGAGVNVVEGALRAGDILQFNNSPATKTVTYLTRRTDGDSTSGPITVRGKIGVQPLLNITNTTVVITLTSAANWVIQNLALKQDGASGNVITCSGAGLVVDSCKITGGGTAGSGISNTSANNTIIRNEITNCGTNAITLSNVEFGVIFGNYIHDNQGDGINISSVTPGGSVTSNIFDTNTGKGVYISGAATTSQQATHINGNVFYANGNGLQVDDADQSVVLTNNIFSSNVTNNVNWVAGNAEIHGYHGYNIFHNGTQTNLTLNSTESTSDPLFTSPAAGNFAIAANSPATATGYPGVFAGALTTGYMDMGAAQIVAGGGGFVIGN